MVAPVKFSSLVSNWRFCSITWTSFCSRSASCLRVRICVLLGADLLAGVLLDGAGAVAGAEDADAVGPLGIERAVDRLGGQRRDDDLDQALALGHVNLAGDQGISLVDRHGGHPARGRLGGRVGRCWRPHWSLVDLGELGRGRPLGQGRRATEGDACR